jgi:hypothetical protein
VMIIPPSDTPDLRPSRNQCQSPAGRSIWTRAAWPASLTGGSTADGMISRVGVRMSAAQARQGQGSRRVRCVPDHAGNGGESRLLTDTPTCPLTWRSAGRPCAADELLSSRSQVRILLGALTRKPRSGHRLPG